MNRPREEYRTSIVRLAAFSVFVVAVSVYAASKVAFAQTAQPDVTEGWLQLKSDQRRYRERAQPLEPRNEAYLEHLEHRQGLQLRESQSRQQQEQAIERRRERMRYPDRPARVSPKPSQGRALERRRLNRRIQRETFGAGRW